MPEAVKTSVNTGDGNPVAGLKGILLFGNRTIVPLAIPVTPSAAALQLKLLVPKPLKLTEPVQLIGQRPVHCLPNVS